jgi:hypothetical protein
MMFKLPIIRLLAFVFFAIIAKNNLLGQVFIHAVNTPYVTTLSGWNGSLPPGFSMSANGSTYQGTSPSTSGGVYAIADAGFGWQATATATRIRLSISIVNRTGCDMDSVSLKYKAFTIVQRNSRQPAWSVTVSRSSTINASWPYNHQSRPDSADWISCSFSFSSPLHNGDSFVLQFESDRGSGSGSSPMIGVDSIGLESHVFSPPSSPVLIKAQPTAAGCRFLMDTSTCKGGMSSLSYQYSIDSGIHWHHIAFDSSSRWYRIDSLTEKRWYFLGLRAANALGHSSPTSFWPMYTGVIPLDTGAFVQHFDTFNRLQSLPTGWICSDTTYSGNWGGGTLSGLRGGGVLGYQHTSAATDFQTELRLENIGPDTLRKLYITYTGRVERLNENRHPLWNVRVNNQEISALRFYTQPAEQRVLTAVLHEVHIPPGDLITISWQSNRGQGTGSSRQIGLSEVIISTRPHGWQLHQPDSLFVIDFDTTVHHVHLGSFMGQGLTQHPSKGQLDAMAWELKGMSDGQHQRGGQATTGDFSRGLRSSQASLGGLYAFELSHKNHAIGLKPSTNDLNPGHLTLTIRNASQDTCRSLHLTYHILVRNTGDRSTSVTPSFSSNNLQFAPLPFHSFTTTSRADTSTIKWKRFACLIFLDSLIIPPGGFCYLRWGLSDHEGNGSRDELALDDITCMMNASQTPFAPSLPSVVDHLMTTGHWNMPSPLTVVHTGIFAHGSWSLHRHRLELLGDSLRLDNACIIANKTGDTFRLSGTTKRPIQQVFKHQFCSHLELHQGSMVLNGDSLHIGRLRLDSGQCYVTSGILNVDSLETVDSMSFVIPQKDGYLQRRVYSEPCVFPVGRDALFSLTITNHTGTADHFNVGLLPEVYDKGYGGQVVDEDRVQNTWIIQKGSGDAANGDGVDLNFQWPSSAVTGNLSHPGVHHYEKQAWFKVTSPQTVSQNQLLLEGYKGTFSPFAIADKYIVLDYHPVVLTYQSCGNKCNTLFWSGFGPDILFFEVELLTHSGQQVMAVTENRFWECRGLEGSHFFRVIGIDAQGSRWPTSWVEVEFSGQTEEGIRVYPNPLGRNRLIHLQLPSHLSDPIDWKLYDHFGRVVASGKHSGSRLLPISLEGIPSGAYVLALTKRGGVVEKCKLVLE